MNSFLLCRKEKKIFIKVIPDSINFSGLRNGETSLTFKLDILEKKAPFLYAIQIVHGDLKASNPILTDYCISSITHSKEGKGTLIYLSPETISSIVAAFD